jgi:hypothetical protein
MVPVAEPHAKGGVPAAPAAALLPCAIGCPPERQPRPGRLGIGTHRRLSRLLKAAEQEIEEAGARNARQGDNGSGRDSAGDSCAPCPGIGARNVPQAGMVPTIAAAKAAGKVNITRRQRSGRQ